LAGTFYQQAPRRDEARKEGLTNAIEKQLVEGSTVPLLAVKKDGNSAV
jgi:hypothetical protein